MRYARDSQRVKLSRNDNLQAPTKYPSSAGRCLHFFTRRPDSVAERPLLIVLVKLPASISHVRVRPIMRAFYASPLRFALSIKVRRCRANLWNSLWCVQLLSRAFASVPRVFTIRRCSTIRRVDISRDLRRGTDAPVHRSHLPRSKRIC